MKELDPYRVPPDVLQMLNVGDRIQFCTRWTGRPLHQPRVIASISLSPSFTVTDLWFQKIRGGTCNGSPLTRIPLTDISTRILTITRGKRTIWTRKASSP